MLPDAMRADLDRYVERLKTRFGTDLVSVVAFGFGSAGRCGRRATLTWWSSCVAYP
jgi:hypothetical protein